MAIVKYAPKSFLETFFDDEFFASSFLPSRIFNTTFVPSNDIIENDNEFKIDIILPGFSKNDVKLSINDGVLSVEGERKEENESKYNTKQSYFGKFKKSYRLPENINIETIDAKFENGILKIILPKVEEEKQEPKLIEIK